MSTLHGRVSVKTTTTTINHDLYDVCSSFTHVGTPSNGAEPTVQRGNAARMRQSSVSDTMTSLARRVVERVATLSGWTTAIRRSTVIATVIHADNSLQLQTSRQTVTSVFSTELVKKLCCRKETMQLPRWSVLAECKYDWWGRPLLRKNLADTDPPACKTPTLDLQCESKK